MTDRALCNVLLLSFAFFCSCSAYVSLFNAQKYILETIKSENPNYHGNAYISLCITFGAVSLFCCVVPSIINILGPRLTLFIGFLLNIFYIAQFLYPVDWLLYFSSFISGCVGAMNWITQGYFLTINSTKDTISRNSGILWAIIQAGCMAGNICILCIMKGDVLDKVQRKRIFVFMIIMCCSAVPIILMLKKAVYQNSENEIEPKKICIQLLKLSKTRDILLLSVTFLYAGLELSFFSGVYSSAIGFTKSFEQKSVITVVSLSGLLVGAGECTGGCLFGLLGRRCLQHKHYPVILLGFFVHIITYSVILINLPNSATNGPTDEEAIIKSNIIFAFICSFALGFADACYCTQIYALLGSHFSNESSAAFAIFKLLQDGSAAGAFFYTSIGLYRVLYILFAFSFLGTICFCIVELKPTYKSFTEETKEEQTENIY